MSRNTKTMTPNVHSKEKEAYAEYTPMPMPSFSKKNTIDWEQRRYEIARDFEATSMASPEYMQFCTSHRNNETPEEKLAKVSIKYADALIEQLKTTIHHEPENI